jgi:hypothetical protein
MVTYNGETTNLTGVGSPNPTKLTLPNLDQVQDPAVQACLLRIQQFVNNLVAPTSGGGGYASLTGPGESITPGMLTQLGAFTVTDTDVSHGITLSTTGSTFVATSTNGANSSSVTLNGGTATMTGTGVVSVTSSGTGSTHIGSAVGVVVQAPGVSIIGSGSPAAVEICRGSGDKLVFFATNGAFQQTIVGSRGGNVALANLLTALQDYGLVLDSTTP